MPALGAATTNQPEPAVQAETSVLLARGILSRFWPRECSAVATAPGETKSLNGSWQWHLKKRRLRRRIAFQIFGFQTYLFATPSLLTICITSVLDWDSNKVYDLLALKNTSLGTSTQRCRGKAPGSHKDSPLHRAPPPEGIGVFRTPHRGQIPLPDLKEEGVGGSCVWSLRPLRVNYTPWLI